MNSIYILFLPLLRLTRAHGGCLDLRRGFWFLRRWGFRLDFGRCSWLGARAKERGTWPGILSRALSWPFFGGTPRQGPVGG